MTQRENLENWYQRRDQLEEGMILRTRTGAIVKLDRGVPGDSTQWYVADWVNGWSYMDSTAQAADFVGEPINQADVQALSEQPFAVCPQVE